MVSLVARWPIFWPVVDLRICSRMANPIIEVGVSKGLLQVPWCKPYCGQIGWLWGQRSFVRKSVILLVQYLQYSSCESLKVVENDANCHGKIIDFYCRISVGTLLEYQAEPAPIS